MLCLAAGNIVCEACQAALPRIEAACRRCAIALPLAGVCGQCQREPAAFDDAIACFEYRFPLDRLVQRFKFGGDLAAGRWLAGELGRVLEGVNADLIVVPPLAPSRLRERGFNQALEIAKVVSRTHGFALAARAIDKRRDTAPQPGLSRTQRAANLASAFHYARRFDDLHVAIVDDVLTTGATAHALATVLKDAGAQRVSVWALARTPAPGR
jgi:ComF family protein